MEYSNNNADMESEIIWEIRDAKEATDFTVSESKPIIDLQEYISVKDKKMSSLKDISLKPASIEIKTLSINLEAEESKHSDSRYKSNISNKAQNVPQWGNRSWSQQKETRDLLFSPSRPSELTSNIHKLKPMTQNKVRRVLSPCLVELEELNGNNTPFRERRSTKHLSITIFPNIL